MKKYILFVVGMLLMSRYVMAEVQKAPVTFTPTIQVSSVSAAANGSVTLTIASSTAVGQFSTGSLTYLTNLSIDAVSTGGAAGGTQVTCTSTNLGGAKFEFVPAVSTGSISTFSKDFHHPWVSTSSAKVEIICPANANILWDVKAWYYQSK